MYPEIRKNLFFASKMGGRLIHGVDLYTGKYGKMWVDRYCEYNVLYMNVRLNS